MTSTSMIEKTATFALYALAALPFIALSVAHAEPATVKISDLNLSQPAQVQEYNARVEHAAAQVCASIDARDLDRQQACKEAVRAEAQDQLTRMQAQAATVTMASR
jgi:UrcA family protein